MANAHHINNPPIKPYIEYTPRYLSTHWIQLLNLPMLNRNGLSHSWITWRPPMAWIQRLEHRLNQVYRKNVIRIVSPVQRDPEHPDVIRFWIEKRPFYAVARWNRLAQHGGDALLAMDRAYELLRRGDRLSLLVNHVPNDRDFSVPPPESSEEFPDSQFYLTKSHLNQITHSFSNEKSQINSRTYLPLYRQHRETRRYVHCELPIEEHVATRIVPRDAPTCALLGGIITSTILPKPN